MWLMQPNTAGHQGGSQIKEIITNKTVKQMKTHSDTVDNSLRYVTEKDKMPVNVGENVWWLRLN